MDTRCTLISQPLPLPSVTPSLQPVRSVQCTTVTMTSTLQTLAFKLAPPSREAGPEQLEPCNDVAGRRYEVVPSVVCSMCCLFGIIYCFFGELSLHVYVCINKTQYLYILPRHIVIILLQVTVCRWRMISCLQSVPIRIISQCFGGGFKFFILFLCRTHVVLF